MFTLIIVLNDEKSEMEVFKLLVSIIIPCYNSEHTLESVIFDINKQFDQRDEFTYEIVLVNDASKDNTFKTMELIQNEYENIICIDFAKNFGQHAALMAGFRFAKGECIVCLDDDGQTDPKELFKLLQALNERTDVVYAKYIEKKHNFLRNIFSYINDRMVCFLLNKKKELYVSSYFAMKKYIVDEIVKYTNSYPYVLGLVLRTTDKIKNVDVVHNERKYGISNYSFRKLLSLWVNGFTSFSIIPLRAASLFGFVFATFGFIFSLYIVLNKLIHPETAVGWSSLISALFFIGGVILIVLGLLGEYIGRSFISLNDAPQYVIRNFKNGD